MENAANALTKDGTTDLKTRVKEKSEMIEELT